MFLQILPIGCHGNQIKLRGYNKKGMFGRGPLKEHFCKSFVKKIYNEIAVNAFTAAGVVQCGGRKTSPRISTIV